MPAPIRPGSSPVASPASATSTSQAPVTPAVPASPARPVWGAQGGAAPQDAFNVVTGRVAEGLKTVGPSDYELIPGRTTNAVGLPQVLQSVGSSPQGMVAVTNLAAQLKAKTGKDIPPEVLSAAMANPAALTQALEVSPRELSAGLQSANGSYQAGKLKDAAPAVNLLPLKFDFASLDALSVPSPAPALKEVAPGLFTGDLPSTVPEAQLKRNRVVAEVFQRLSANASAKAEQKFEVRYGGKAFTTLDGFAGALKADGYEVKVSFEQRAANFADLKAQVPGSNPPAYLDVPAPMLVKTGFRDALGHEAVVPAAHSEMVVSLRSGPSTQGPKLDADVKFYQGISGTGFFPCNTVEAPGWVGHVSHGEVSGEKALQALRLAGDFTDVVNTTAKDKHLYAGGYGLTGVCNDSVAVVQQALLGRADQYPLLMKDELLYAEIQRHLSTAKGADKAAYRALLKAIKELPSDTKPNATMKRRALASIPWGAGQEPFQSTVEARKILGG